MDTATTRMAARLDVALLSLLEKTADQICSLERQLWNWKCLSGMDMPH